MAWEYSQALGTMKRGFSAFNGYSGHGEGLNNPAMEDDVGIGPIPRGIWKIGPFDDTHKSHLGPFTAALEPVGHDAHGRTGFFCHGDNSAGNHSASHGCIILPRTARTVISDSGDTDLIVK